MPPVLIVLLITLGLVSFLGFFTDPWATLMALGIGLAVMLAVAVVWGAAVYLNRPSRRR